MDRFISYFILFINLLQLSQTNNNIAYNIPDPECTGAFNLCTDADKERLGRQAIKAIHEQMDDDKDGMIEASESRDFIKEELESKGDSIRHRVFENADLQITFDDLWTQWKHSAVYNWTNDQVVEWLIYHIQLPIYVDNFRRNQFDGRMIPRLVANEKHYLSAIMQIRDPRHKRRLIIKATDVVLFGSPPRTHNLVKDLILMSALLISIGACLYAFVRHRKTQESMKTMVKELEMLQKAEGDLVSVTGKMKAMENELKDKTKVDRGLLNTWYNEVQQTKDEAEKYRKRRGSTVDHEKQLRLAVQEIEQLRIALRKAEEHARYQSFEAPSELIDLLKRTYHIEEMACDTKRKSAEQAMLAAKEQMIKISKMQKGFFGAVRIAHTGCMDNISELINDAKERLADVHEEYEEREKRWNRIGSLLDREDLISNSSTSTTPSSIGGLNGSLNNGIVNSASSDSNNRLKQTSIDSNNDSLSVNKTNSYVNNRGSSQNPIQISQQDTLSLIDSAFEQSNTPSAQLKRRALGNSTLFNNRLSTERLLNPSTIAHSRSTNALNGLNDQSTHSTDNIRHNTYEYLDIVPSSSSKQTRPIFDLMSDSQIEDQQYDRKSNISDRTNDDTQSISSSAKTRKHTISSKLLKPFQNLRNRKKE